MTAQETELGGDKCSVDCDTLGETRTQVSSKSSRCIESLKTANIEIVKYRQDYLDLNYQVFV